MAGILVFVSVIIAGGISGFVAQLSWRRRASAGMGHFAAFSLTGCFLAMTEALSMLSSSPERALFWFRTGFLFIAMIPALGIIFTLQYRGLGKWLSKKVVISLFIVPLLTQISVWSNEILGLWVRRDVGFVKSGGFWLADTSGRISGFWFLIHMFYSISLLAIGMTLLATLFWKFKRRYVILGLLASMTCFAVFGFFLIPVLDQAIKIGFNPFVQVLGLSVGLLAVIIFRLVDPEEKRAVAAELKNREKDLSMTGSPAVLILIFVLLASGIVTIGVLSFRQYKKNIRDQAKEQLETVVRLKTEAIHQWRQERLMDAEIVCRNPSFDALVKRFLKSPENKRIHTQLQTWFSGFPLFRQYERIFLLDASGVERFSMPPSPSFVSGRSRENMTYLLKTGDPYFYDFHRSGPGKTVSLEVVVPFRAEGSSRDSVRLEGCLVFRVDPALFLFPFIQKWPSSSRSAETLLVRREGEEVLFLNELRFRKNTALALRYPLSRKDIPAVRAAMGEQGVVEGKDYRDVPVLAALAAVSDSPWFLVARMDLNEIDAPLRKRLWQMLFFLVALIAASSSVLGNLWVRQRARYFRGRAETARALQESLERFELANRATYDIIWDWDLRTDAVWWNENFPALFGYRSEDIEPNMKSWFRLIHPDDRERIDSGVHSAIVSGDNYWAGSYRFLRKDGLYADVEDRGYISRDENGLPVRMIGAMQDITERRKTEEALRESEERYRQLLERAPVGIMVVSEGKIVFVNSSGSRLLGENSKEKIVGRTIEEILHPSIRDEGLKRINRLSDGESPNNPTETIFMKSDGTSVDAQVMVAPLTYRGRSAIQVIAIDITMRKKAEQDLRSAQAELQFLLDEAVRSRHALLSMIEDGKAAEEEIRTLNAELENRVRQRTAQLEAANKELEAFTYSVSHDLRAPLRAVNGYTRILMEDYEQLLDAEGRRVCAVISDSALNMGRLIDDLLSLSRFGHSEMKWFPVDMKTLANSIFYEVTTPEARARIDFRLGELPEAFGDPVLLRQVWMNLLANAVKFSSRRDRAVIEVECDETDEEIIYLVKDNGVGFDMQYVQKLFGVFQRLHGDREFEGTGVGLAIVQRIVQRHGGRVWAEGRIDGGAVFHFALRRKEV